MAGSRIPEPNLGAYDGSGASTRACSGDVNRRSAPSTDGRGRYLRRVRLFPTAPAAGGSFILGYAVVVGSGSRFIGGLVLLAGGIVCARLWLRRRGPRTAAALTGAALAMFVASHVLALLIGAWPAVLSTAAAMTTISWIYADAPTARAIGLNPSPH
jgi:hypothetical protein